MSNLAQNQLDFQVYNQKMNGPTSPIDMDTLKKNAEAEAQKQAALGKTFDASTASYVEREQIYEAGRNDPTPVLPSEEIAKLSPTIEAVDSPTALGKRKSGPVEFDKATYEVYTTTGVADAFGNKTTRVVYMGREHYSSAKEARDVADMLRVKGMETFVFRCNRTVVKNRKRVKGPPRKKKPAVHKPKLMSLNDLWGYIGGPCPYDLSDWQCLPGCMDAKGKQQTWWIPSDFDMHGQPTNEQIRNAAVCMKQIRASELVRYVESCPEGLTTLGSFIQCQPYYIKPHPETGGEDKAKIRQTTLRIRKCLPGFVPKSRAKSSGMTPVAPVSDAVSPASEVRAVHPPQATPLYTD